MARPNLDTLDRPSMPSDQRLLHALGVPFAHASETSTTGFALVDPDGIVQWATAAFSRLTRVTGASLGAPLAERLDERFRLAIGEAHAAFDSPQACTLELIEGRDGVPVWLHIAALDGQRRIVVAVAADPAGVRSSGGATEETTIDPLTRLGNRHLLERALREASSARSDVALITIGLDGFGVLNDAHGRVTCDRLLALVGDRLRRVCRSDDLLVRLDGDRFAVLHSPGEDGDSASRISSRIGAQFDRPFELDNRRIEVDASAGIARTGIATTTPDDLLAHSLDALSAAKAAGGATWRDYEPGTDG